MLRAHVDRGGRDAADVERGVRLLQRLRADDGVLDVEVAAFEGHGGIFEPAALHKLDALVHHRVALVVAGSDGVGGELLGAAPGDEVHHDAPAAEVIERRDHLRHDGGRDEPGARGDEHLQPLGPGRDHRGRDPGFVAGRRDGYERVFEPGVLGGGGDFEEEVEARGHEVVRGEAIAVGWDVPAEAQGS